MFWKMISSWQKSVPFFFFLNSSSLESFLLPAYFSRWQERLKSLTLRTHQRHVDSLGWCCSGIYTSAPYGSPKPIVGCWQSLPHCTREARWCFNRGVSAKMGTSSPSHLRFGGQSIPHSVHQSRTQHDNRRQALICPSSLILVAEECHGESKDGEVFHGGEEDSG